MSLSIPKFDSAPFYVEHSHTTEFAGRFTPKARLCLSDTLRTCGLLAHLRDEETRTLLALLSFTTANGLIQGTAPELAASLHVSERNAKDRLNRLARMQWQGAPLLGELPRENSRSAYSPSPTLVGIREAVASVGVLTTLPIPAFAPRETIIAQSRATYATPRAVAERMVEEQLGRSPEELADTPEGDVRRRLRSLGISRDDADRLFANHTAEEIDRQLKWLPLRGAKSPTRYLVAAVEGSYAAPSSVGTASDLPSGKVMDKNEAPE